MHSVSYTFLSYFLYIEKDYANKRVYKKSVEKIN